MLFSRAVLDRIASGEVTLAFRRWRRRPPVQGATLRTSVGVLSLHNVQAIAEDEITEEDARRSGATSRAQLVASLRAEGTLLRIEIRLLGPDPRALLREGRVSGEEQAAEVLDRLRRFDERASRPWTQSLLRIVGEHPGLAARELAKLAAMEVAWLKRRVRSLKDLGLTESLATGYRLSPRGEDTLQFMARRSRA